MKRLLCVVLFLVFGTLACQQRLMWWKEKPGSYRFVLRQWTREKRTYQGLKTILAVSATYVHPDVRRVHVRQYSEDQHLSERQAKKFSAKEEAKAKEQLEFIVTTFSDDEDWWQLDGDVPIWTVYLTNDKGVRIKPREIKLFKDVPIYIRTYYPLVSAWKNVYRVTFPVKNQNTPFLDEQNRHFSMEFLSAVGQLRLQWDLKGGLS